MTRNLRLAVLTALLVVVTGSTAFTSTFPTVEFMGFDQGTFTYTYRVTQWTDCVYPFDQFEVDAYTLTSDPYTATGPWVGGVNWGWAADQVWWDPPTKRAGYTWSTFDVEKQVPPYQYWVGEFVLSVPSSQPVEGTVWTVGGAYWESWHDTVTTVPGPVPEPGGLTALAGLLAGIGPVFLRRPRR